MNLVFVRHGQSIWNLKNKFTGWVDIGLSDQGIQEAITAGKTLIENNFIPVSINVFGLIDNDLSYSKQNINIDSNYTNCKYRVTQSLESPKVLHLKSLNDREFSFRNPIIYDENSNTEIRIETIVNSDCPAGSYELNFKIRRQKIY